MKVISKIETNTEKTFKIGQKINGEAISFFEDKSIENPETSVIDSLYLAKNKNEEVLVSIEHMPVIVYYQEKEKSLEKIKQEEMNIKLEQAVSKISKK